MNIFVFWYVTGTQQESKNYKERVPAIPYMYGNGEDGLPLRDVFVKGTVLDIHCLLYTSRCV